MACSDPHSAAWSGRRMIRVSYNLPDLAVRPVAQSLPIANQEAHRLHHRALGTSICCSVCQGRHKPGAWALRFSGFDLAWLRSQSSGAIRAGTTWRCCPVPCLCSDLTAYVERISGSTAESAQSVTPQQITGKADPRTRQPSRYILKRRWISWWLLRWLLRGVAEPGAAGVSPDSPPTI